MVASLVSCLLGCSATAPAPAPAPAPTPAPPAAPAPAPAAPAPDDAADGRDPPRFEGTTGETDVPYRGTGAPPVLREVRATARPGFDRVVFTFDHGLPGYHLAYADGPVRECGSGEPAEVAGDALLEVRFTPAAAHTEEGKPTVPFVEKALDLGTMRELQRTCDFEAMVVWGIGLGARGPYRVIERTDPPRLVVDVRTDGGAP